MRKFFVVFLSVLLYSCQAQVKQEPLVSNADNNTLLWEVSGSGLAKPSYLFGTFHLMCRGDINISTPLRTALKNAATVYMEMDMDDPTVALGGLFLMNMKDGKKLKDLYTEAEYKRLTDFFKDSLHIGIQFFERTKPYFLTAMLYPKMMPCKTVSGVEEELIKVAKVEKKEIMGLETIQFQAAVFDSISYEEQAKDLLSSIDSMERNASYFDTMVTVYKNQQLGVMQSLFNKSEMGVEEHQDLLLDKRNKNWVQQLKKIMAGKPVFVAVGAGHLVGNNGLIELLRREGYTLRPLYNK